MKRLLLSILVLSLLAGLAFGQVTAIKDIQMTEDESGDSPLKDQVVTISGIVTAEPYAFAGDGYVKYWVQDANEPWSGVMVYERVDEVAVAEGDSVTLTGTVSEYYGLTEITNVTDFVIEKEGVFGIEPMVVTTGEIATDGAMAEAYEGCLVKIENATITDPDLGFGEWSMDDGSGACRADAVAPIFFDPTKYNEVKSLCGVLDYSYSNTKILPRLAYDIVEGGMYTRLQRIQQVRHTDLMKALDDAEADTSYMRGDTLTVKGIVTMPTGLSYAGDGIKFIFAEPEGGPWSAILSYNPDSTSYPALFEGDEIEMTGWIDEYTTGPANMTEFWITSPINITNVAQPLPPVDSVATGDLRVPVTAEQWGNVMVNVSNAEVVDINSAASGGLQYEILKVDDGSGAVLIDDDSDSLATFYSDAANYPPLGTQVKSATGWVYHHYGAYLDSTAYKLCPLYVGDIVFGAGPPSIKNTMRDIASATSADQIKVSTTVETKGEIATVSLFYKVGEGEYTEMAMTENEGSYEASIPAQAAGSLVSYYVKAEDTEAQVTTDPASPAKMNYTCVVKDEPITIKDVQYTPWEMADSPFEGFTTTVEGIVTCDSSYFNKFEAYSIQDGEGAWNGIYITGAVPYLQRGDKVKVTGLVTDYNPAWAFKWGNNTVIIVDEVEVISSGNEVPAASMVATNDLASLTPSAESFESSLVKVEKAQLMSINSYDVTIDDGSGPCLLDDDGTNVLEFNSDGYIVVAGDTIYVGDEISIAQGVFTYSFGTHKISVRDAADMGRATGVKDRVASQPLTFQLEQNYPNPFNPTTNIYYEVPQVSDVTLAIYNIRGQHIKTLVQGESPAGKHIVHWDGTDKTGFKVASGVYVYRMKAGDFISHKKMMLVK